MIAVTFALPAESSDFICLLQESRRTKRDGIEIISGTLRGRAIAVFHTGVGEKSTRTRLTTFLSGERPETLISAGFAGALREPLGVGDLLLAENRSAPSLLSSARTALAAENVAVGLLTTAHAVVDSPATREKIARETSALAVDMETEFIAEICAGFGIPMISLRAITDTPAAPFPAPPEVLFNLERQRTEFAPLFWYLLAHPVAIPRLLRFAAGVAKCRRRLTTALDLLLQTPLG